MSDFTLEKLQAFRESYSAPLDYEGQTAYRKELWRLLQKCSISERIQLREAILGMQQMGYKAAEALAELKALEEKEAQNA